MAGGNVPANLRGLFQQAGQQYHIPPWVLAGVASVESNLGANAGPSSAGALGLMQFMPATARGLGVNPYDPRSAIFGAAKLLNQFGYQQNPLRALGAYNGGPGNPQYGYANQVMSEANRLRGQLAGGAPGASPAMASSGGSGAPAQFVQKSTVSFNQKGFDQAKRAYMLGQFLKSSQDGGPFNVPVKGAQDFGGQNPLISSGLIPTQAPDPAAFQVAHNTLQRVAGSTPLSVHPSTVPGYKGYVNPIPGFNLGRTDMGVDASAAVGAPIRAIGDSQLVQVLPNWYSNQPLLLFKLLNGPLAGRYWYVAEQISSRVHQGQVVHAGDTVATFAGHGTGIEIGWGSPTSNSRTLAGQQGNTGDAQHNNAPAGIDFRNFLGTLHG